MGDYAYPLHAGAPCIFDGSQRPTTAYRCERDKHLAGILAHWKWGVTNAFMEGLNSVFSGTKRRARGYRSTTHLTTMLYFVAGKLRLPQF